MYIELKYNPPPRENLKQHRIKNELDPGVSYASVCHGDQAASCAMSMRQMVFKIEISTSLFLKKENLPYRARIVRYVLVWLELYVRYNRYTIRRTVCCVHVAVIYIACCLQTRYCTQSPGHASPTVPFLSPDRIDLGATSNLSKSY